MSFDDNALFRQTSVAEMRDASQEDPREAQASQHGLNYVGLSGDIGCIINGAGLAMATMDMIKYCGGEPANFLDLGGGASPERVAEAFRLVLSDRGVKAILVNIFAGINGCDWVANGVVQAARGLSVPLIVRLTTSVGIGGDPINGSSFLDHLALFSEDPETQAVAMIGEIGGQQEAEASAWIKENMRKPVIGYIAGLTAPKGRRMGHAGAIISAEGDTAAEKAEIMKSYGLHIAPSAVELGATVAKALATVG